MGGSMKNMKFFNVGKGKFGREFQHLFEKCQDLAFQRSLPVEIKCKMVIHPPDNNDPEYGGVEYELEYKEPKTKSVRHTTVLSGGRIVSDGTDVSDILQYDLFEDQSVEQKMHQ